MRGIEASRKARDMLEFHVSASQLEQSQRCQDRNYKECE